MLKARFGKPNRARRNYDEIVVYYNGKLKEMAPTLTPGGMVMKQHPAKDKAKLLAKFTEQGVKLAKSVGKWSEKDLDKYLLPHPLMGKMMVREMLLWAIYHNYHHLNNLKANY